MNKQLLYSLVGALALAVPSTAEAKSKKKKKHDRDRIVYVERSRSWDDYRGYSRTYRDYGDRGDFRYYRRGPSRTIYVIERNRPVARTVYCDHDGRYYRWMDGERRYVRSRYFESYPSRYYYRDGRPRLSVSFSL